MIRSVLMGLAAGARAITPLAVVANAARTGRLPAGNAAPRFLAHPLISLGTTALAAYELVGDKQRSAPDRIITPAVLVRSWNAAFAGMVMAPRNHRFAAGVVAGATAALASYASYALRMRAMNGKHQVATGLVEDALTLSAATAAAIAPFPDRLTHFTTPATPGHSAPA
ncbi:DUF4126 family protein [Sphingomonas sp. HITSZ_GF]|uniref:DUF4126 family protein n=1 Tax=Sphingomonas sp. HITSZ_GF TaxID=3037247 RepID=UPI00240DC699|nr:DUF4126 family protein [Sphingomonas sp. HITSZ_GF]MDG2532482.1 DUF4126 family protein [Sphingomonas sp. HITSZ_GF]